MQKTVITPAIAVLAACLPAVAHAQSSASATATGSTTIVQPIGITRTANLSFGRLVRPASGGVYAVLYNGIDLVDEDEGLIVLDHGEVSRAKFTITGEGGQAVSISVPANFTMTNGANSIEATLEADTGTVISLSGSLGSTGTAELNLGSAFLLTSTQATGFYSGTFTVTVAYQ